MRLEKFPIIGPVFQDKASEVALWLKLDNSKVSNDSGSKNAMACLAKSVFDENGSINEAIVVHWKTSLLICCEVTKIFSIKRGKS
jgi:hypothetical protein